MKSYVNTAREGDRLLATLAALANAHRMRVVAALVAGGRNYVSQLAREIGISRPLLHLHLQKLEEAGLVTSKLELSRDGKALNYFEVTEFAFHLTPAAVADAAKTLTDRSETWRIPMISIFYILTLVLPLATILIVFRMRYHATLQEARARLASDDAYRQLAETGRGG